MLRRSFIARYLFVGLAAVVAAVGLRAQAPAKADAEFLRKAYESYREMRKSSPHAAIPWQYLGPTNISGRATDIAVADRQAGRRIYVAYATSGLWKTDDNGATWQAIFDDMPSTSIGDIAIAPSAPDTVWVGTGEANLFRASMAGVGIYKSTDGGQTFTHMGLSDTQTIGRILVHPTESGHRLRRRLGARVDRQRNARRFQDDRRRQDVAQGLLPEPADRRVGPGDGSLESGRHLRLDVAAHPPQMERPAGRARIQRRRCLEDDRWRQRHGARRIPDCQPRRSAGGSASISRARTRSVLYALVDNYEQARPAREGERDAYQRADLRATHQGGGSLSL